MSARSRVVARLTLALLAGVGAAGSGIGLLATSAWLLSRAAQHPPVLYLMVAIVAVRTFGISRGVLRYVERLLSHDAAFRMMGALRARTYARLERIAPTGLLGHRFGDVVARVVSDVDALQDLVLRVLLPGAVAAVVSGATIMLVGTVAPAAAAALGAATLTAFVLAPWLVVRRARHAEATVAPTRGALAASAATALRAAPDLVAFGATDTLLREIATHDAALRRAERRSAWSSGLGAGLVTLAVGGATTAALVSGVPAVAEGRLPGVLFATVVLVPLALHEMLSVVPASAQLWLRSAGALRRVRELDRIAVPTKEPTRPSPLPDGPYDLSVRDLVAGWPGGPPVLDGLDVDLPAGRRIAVVGRSGSGKTTLAAVLVRFLDPRAGAVTIDGVDTTDLASDDVRTAVGLLAQDAHVFDTTIAENLRIAKPDATTAELTDALRRARLWHSVERMPDGIETLVGEHGDRLSGGERQRLNLARALLADFPILVLDEPTEHLDEPTANALTADLLAATEGRSVVLMTHRLAGLDQVDEIIDLDRGNDVGQRRRSARARGPSSLVT